MRRATIRIGRTRHTASRAARGPVLLRGALGLAVCMSGCGSMTTGNDGWAYSGTDPALRTPAPVITPDMTPEMRLQSARDSLEVWKQRTSQAVADAKASCVKETGEFGTPGTWTGYTSTMVACMRAHGWRRASNPL